MIRLGSALRLPSSLPAAPSARPSDEESDVTRHAAVILRERVTLIHGVGIAAAGLAVVLITAAS
jgi:hypothetical protein